MVKSLRKKGPDQDPDPWAYWFWSRIIWTFWSNDYTVSQLSMTQVYFKITKKMQTLATKPLRIIFLNVNRKKFTCLDASTKWQTKQNSDQMFPLLFSNPYVKKHLLDYKLTAVLSTNFYLELRKTACLVHNKRTVSKKVCQ